MGVTAIAVPNGTLVTFGSWDFVGVPSIFVRNIRLEGCSRVMHDVTALSQTGAAQYIASAVTQPGKMILDIWFDEDRVLHASNGLAAAIDGTANSRAAAAIVITAPDGSKISTNGIVESYDIQIEHDSPKTGTVTVQLTSLMAFSAS